jgi:protein-L-isoaspartate O-methyltransferase
MQDYYDTHRLERQQLVESLRNRGGIDDNVLDALERLPREEFINPAFANKPFRSRLRLPI